jgi:hypothetical protein
LRLLLDEMYAPVVAAELRRRGDDVMSVHDLGSALPTGATDAEVLAFAQREECVLVTENLRDYRPLESGVLSAGSHHAGIVYTSDRRFPRGDPATVGALVQALDALLRAAPDLRDRSLFLERVDA